MSDSPKTEVIEKVEDNSIESEDRIDSNAVHAFRDMGYKERLSNNMVRIYKTFKARADRLQPGRLTPEGFAFVSILSDMADGKLNLE